MDDYGVHDLRRMAAEQGIAGRHTMNKQELYVALGNPIMERQKVCSDYSIYELRKMAAERNIPGRSKMGMLGLANAMGISTVGGVRKRVGAPRGRVSIFRYMSESEMNDWADFYRLSGFSELPRRQKLARLNAAFKRSTTRTW